MAKNSESPLFHEPVVTRRLAFSLDLDQAKRLSDHPPIPLPADRSASSREADPRDNALTPDSSKSDA
jgi:hypothetical protein